MSCTDGSSPTDSGGGGGGDVTAGSELLGLLLLLPLPLLGCGAAAAALEVASTLRSGVPGGLPRGGCRLVGSGCHGLHLAVLRCKPLRAASAGRPNGPPDNTSVPGIPGRLAGPDLKPVEGTSV